MNFQTLGFLDVSMLAATLLTRHRKLFDVDRRRQESDKSPHHATRSIFLRLPPGANTVYDWTADVPHADADILEEWKQAQNVLRKIKHLAAPFVGGQPAELGKAMIVELKPGGTVDWHRDEGAYAEAHHRLHVGLVWSPGAALFCGSEGINPSVGQVVWMNNRQLHSAVNVGANPRVHLIVDVRKPVQQ